MDDACMEDYQTTMLMDSQQAPGGIIVYDAKTEQIIHVNQYLIDLCECESVYEFMQFMDGSVYKFVYEEDVNVVRDSIRSQVEKRDGYEHIFYRVKTKTGQLVNVEEYGRLARFGDGREVFYAFVTKATQGDFADWLTGLPSMARFHYLAANGFEIMVERGELPVAIALDLVDMKSFNTHFGREEGDKLLRAFANVLRKYFGSEACSRYAEDHFYAFAPDEGIQEKIESLFEDFKNANGGNVLPVRVGVYVCDPDDDIVAVGFDRAKSACDHDRFTWSSHITWFGETMKQKDKLRLHVLNHVDQSISEGWIRPYYQPIVRSATGDICCEEALARWVDPEYGLLSPDQFIPVLEEAGLLHKLDMRIVDCVLADFEKKRSYGIPVVPVSVNISLRDLDNIDIAAEISERADAAHVPHDLLRIEFTESAVSENPEFFRTQVVALRDLGFRVWMDDFGSGYSSLNTLQEFDFDLIKLDMGFVKKCEHDKKARDIIAGVVQIARNMGISTLSEGVETEQQASYLESIGCDVLQGYYFMRPRPLDAVIEHFGLSGEQRENLQESAYWRAICGFDLLNPTANQGGMSVDGTPIAEFPAGVLERRRDDWRVVRANESFQVFLNRVGLLSNEGSNLSVQRVEKPLSEEFHAAANRAKASGAWERNGSRLEYGTGLQFYTKFIADAPDVEAFAVASVPTMLGTALGSYGDVPVAYAVFRVVYNDIGDEVVNAEYVYANRLYHEWLGLNQETLTGRSFLEAVGKASAMWFPYCYRAAVLGETVHDVVFSPELGHWLSFCIAPSPVKDCCVYAFMMADDERMERDRIKAGLDTADLVIEITNVLNNEDDYDTAMNQALEMMSGVIHPERLYVFERGEETSDNTFEWCAEGIEPMIDSLQGLDNSEFDTWEKLMADEAVVIIPDVAEFKDVDPQMYWQLERQGITHLLAVPFVIDGELIGYLGADNYALDERLDTRRLLETVATFMGSRIASHRLLRELERAGTHDSLTGLLNRRGIDQAVAERIAARGEERFALALMDIDNFKSLNDANGRGFGDEALKVVTTRLVELFPDSAIIGRNGSEEFLVVLFDKDADSADSLFNALQSADLKCEYNGELHTLTMSVGYAECPDQVDTVKKAYTLADAALYAVKLAGKSAVMKYSAELEAQYRSQLGFTPRDIAENIPGAVMVHHAGGEGDILFANDELVNLFECESFADFMEHTKGTFRGVVHPEDQKRVYDELAKIGLEEVGEPNYSDFRVLTKTGNIKHISDSGRLARIEDVGKVFYVLMLDRKNLDEK